MTKDLEESLKVDRVRDLVERIQKNHLDRFGEVLPADLLLMHVEAQIVRAKHDLIEEGLSHLYRKAIMDPSDLFRAKDILTPKPAPALQLAPEPTKPKVLSVAKKAPKPKDRLQ